MKRFFSLSAALLFATLLLIFPECAAAGVRSGLALCVQTVIPSLFPFFVVTTLLLSLGLDGVLRPLCAPLMRPLFRLRGECAAPLVAGFLGGYPTGARTAAQLYRQGTITRAEAERLLGFCNNCGPGFLIGYVGVSILGSASAGATLLAIHLLSALCAGMVICRLPGKSEPPPLPCSFPAQSVSLPAALTASVAAALRSTAGICAYVVFFRTAAALLGSCLPPFTLGILEMVSALAALSNNAATFVTAAGIVSWGGICVHFQTMSVVGDLSLRYHTAGKLLQTGISLILASLVILMKYFQ